MKTYRGLLLVLLFAIGAAGFCINVNKRSDNYAFEMWFGAKCPTNMTMHEMLRPNVEKQLKSCLDGEKAAEEEEARALKRIDALPKTSPEQIMLWNYEREKYLILRYKAGSCKVAFEQSCHAACKAGYKKEAENFGWRGFEYCL